MGATTVSDAINSLADQFEEQYREDHRELRAELAGLRHILSALVLQAGGELRLGDRDRLQAQPDDELAFRLDTDNRCLVIRRSSGRPSVPRPTGERSGERLPDWML